VILDDDEGVRLSLKQHARWAAIKACVAGRSTAKAVATSCGLSVRQVRRLVKRARHLGLRCVVHGNCGRVSNRRLKPALASRICSLYRDRYDGFNLTHFREMLQEREGLRPPCREIIRRVLLAEGLWERRRKAPKHRERRPRREREGEMLQIDASIHRWFGEDRPSAALVGAVDDATGKVAGALFAEAETTHAYMTMLRSVAEKHGVPVSIYSDRDSVFFVSTRKDREEAFDLGRPRETQFGRLLRELGTTLIPASSPQAKGRVERLWGTFQDRLFHELRLEKIVTIEAANRYLSASFLPRHNRKFAVPPARSEAAWREKPGPARTAAVFCLKESRTLGNDQTFSYEGKIWQVRRTSGVQPLPQRKIEVRTTLKGQMQAWHGERRLRLAVAPMTLRLIKPDSSAPLTRIGRAEAAYTRRARMHL
jgi:hypothetical protein